MRYPTPNRQRFAIETLDGKHVGNCTYYGIDETKSEAELGIIIGNRDYWNQGYGTDAITTLVNHIFQQTKLNRIYLKTLETNARAQRCFEKCGFAPYGHLKRDGYNFVLMELNREEWEKQQD
jgi:RimJ/RimL family protein N-acetyltransferase